MGGELPQTTGREVAGIVDEVGEGVTDVTVGPPEYSSRWQSPRFVLPG